MNILILDLDGVLITTPSWKGDEIDTDGYFKFSEPLVNNLNILLESYKMEIWLSSSRRKMKTLDEFNEIFSNRNIKQSISGFVDSYDESLSRREEVIKFLSKKEYVNLLIIDDDKSFRSFDKLFNHQWVETNQHSGFDSESLDYALEICKSWSRR